MTQRTSGARPDDRDWATNATQRFCFKYTTRVLADLAGVGQPQINRVIHRKSRFDPETASRVGRLVAPDRRAEFVGQMSDARPNAHLVEPDDDGAVDDLMRDASSFRVGLNFGAAAARYQQAADHLGTIRPRGAEALLMAAECHLERDDVELARRAIVALSDGGLLDDPNPYLRFQLRRVRLRVMTATELDAGLIEEYAELGREAALLNDERSRDQAARDRVRLHAQLAERGLRQGHEVDVARHLDEALRECQALLERRRPAAAARALHDLQVAALCRMHYENDSRKYAQFDESARLAAAARRYFTEHPHDPRGALVELEDAHRCRVVENSRRAQRSARQALRVLSAVGHVTGQRAALRLLADLSQSAHERLALCVCTWACGPDQTSFEAGAAARAMTAAAHAVRRFTPSPDDRRTIAASLRLRVVAEEFPFRLLPDPVETTALTTLLDELLVGADHEDPPS